MTMYLYDSDISLPAGMQDQIARVVEQHLKPTAANGSGALSTLLSLVGITLDSNGDIVANIVPRRDTLTNLLAIAGSAGEIASASDQPAIVQFNGNVGGAVVYTPDGTCLVPAQFTTSQTYTAPFIPSHLVMTGATTGTQTVLLRLPAGKAGVPYSNRVKVLFFDNGAGTTTFKTDVAVQTEYVFISGLLYELFWNGTEWTPVDGGCVLLGTGTMSTSLGGGGAGGNNCVALGVAASTAVDNTLVLGTSAMPVVPGTKSETAIQGGSKTFISYVDVYKFTSAATAAELTVDGAAASSSNRITFANISPITSSVARVRITLIGKSSTTDAYSNTYDLLLNVATSGTVTLLGAVVAGTAITAGAFTAPTAVTIGVTGSKLSISVTPANATATTWVASAHIIRQGA